MVRECLEPLHAGKQIACAFLRTRRKFGSAKIADHEGMAGQNEPRFLRTGVIGNYKRDVFRRVAGSVHYLDCDVSQFEHIAVADFVEWEVYIRASEQHVLRACGLS